MSDGPYLFDVGVTALAHTDAPVRDKALSYLQQAITGEIDAIVPYASVVGAHNALTSYYGISNERASRLMQNFMEAKRIHWYDDMAESVVRDGFSRAGKTNIGGWDGFYAQVAIEEGAETVLTIDNDFQKVEGVNAKVILSSEEFAALSDYLGY